MWQVAKYSVWWVSTTFIVQTTVSLHFTHFFHSDKTAVDGRKGAATLLSVCGTRGLGRPDGANEESQSLVVDSTTGLGPLPVLTSHQGREDEPREPPVDKGPRCGRGHEGIGPPCRCYPPAYGECRRHTRESMRHRGIASPYRANTQIAQRSTWAAAESAKGLGPLVSTIRLQITRGDHTPMETSGTR